MTRPDQTEAQIKSDILATLGALPHVFVWNHPTGVARTLTPPYSVIRFGLNGSPDIVGAVAYTITAADVGRTVGLALGIEVKTPTGRQRDDQKRFQAAWERRAAGIYILARSIDDVLHGLPTTTTTQTKDAP